MMVSVLSQVAQAELAYDLQTAKTKQDITKEEVQIDIVERRKLVDIEDKEIVRFVYVTRLLQLSDEFENSVSHHTTSYL